MPETMTQEQKAEAIREYIAQCNGFENHYMHWTRAATYSDGVRMIAETAGAYWLIDAIMSHVKTNKNCKAEPFMVWTLKLNKTGGAVLSCTDGGKGVRGKKLPTQRIEFTDFPLDEVKFYLENGVLCLPGER